jgi:hypothetical protein
LRTILERTTCRIQETTDDLELVGVLQRSADPLIVLLDADHVQVLNVVLTDRRLVQRHAYLLLTVGSRALGPACTRYFARHGLLILPTAPCEAALLDAVEQASQRLRPCQSYPL